MLNFSTLLAGPDRTGVGDEFDIPSIRETNTGLDRAFLASYLLTANLEEAEAAVLTAMESWEPKSESREQLFWNTVQIAAAVSAEQTALVAAYQLPSQLENVLKLAEPQRRSLY